MSDQEIEVKFYVHDLKKIELRLLELKAQLIQPRVHEVNYRYDLPDGSMKATGQVLRLRQDQNMILTYKGTTEESDGVSSRTELETTVGDIQTARRIIKALGYVQIMVYEKYRATYDFDHCHIMLDELPYGDFVEIEGANAASIRSVASQIGLNFNSAAGASYSRIYENYNVRHGHPPRDLTFEVFGPQKPTAQELGMRPADL